MRHPLRTAPRAPERAGAGFTLAEAAITIALVGMVVVMILQGLEGAKMNALYVKNRKTAYELGVGLLGEVRVGLYREELESGMSGDFAEQDHPEFEWEVVLGDDVFEEADRDDTDRPYDNYQRRRELQEERDAERDSRFVDEDEEAAAEEPFEKIKVRVTYPKVRTFPSELVLEAWVPWVEVYGEDEEEETELGAAGAAPPGGAPAGEGDG